MLPFCIAATPIGLTAYQFLGDRWQKSCPIAHELDPTQAVTWASKEDLIFNNPNIGIGDIAYVVGLFHL